MSVWAIISSGFETTHFISSAQDVPYIHFTIHFTTQHSTAQQRHSVSKHTSKQMVGTIPLAYSYSYSQNLPNSNHLSSRAPTFSLSLSLFHIYSPTSHNTSSSSSSSSSDALSPPSSPPSPAPPPRGLAAHHTTYTRTDAPSCSPLRAHMSRGW